MATSHARPVAARLLTTHLPRDPEGVVLVLHGGAARRHGMRVSPAQLSVLRMVPVAARLAQAGRGRLAVFRLLNSVRGWDTHHTPVDDVTWALGRLREQLGDAAADLPGRPLARRPCRHRGRQPARGPQRGGARAVGLPLRRHR